MMIFTFRFLIVAVAAASLTGCASHSQSAEDSLAQPTASMPAADAENNALLPPKDDETEDTIGGIDETKLVFKRRVSPREQKRTEKEFAFSTEQIQLQFSDAPADEVARIVLSQALGANVAIAGTISERISLLSEQTVSSREAVSILEDALAAVDLLLIESDNGFLLKQRSEASGTRSVTSSRGVGYGVQSIAVQNTQPSQILRLIAPFTTEGVSLTPNDAQALIFVEGPASEVGRVREVIARFDTPDLQNRVYGLFSPQYVDAATLQAEMQPLLQATIGDTANLIEVVPLPRLNQLFVLTRTQEQFHRVQDWIFRLDQPSFGDEQRLYYYRVNNAPADALAAQLDAAFRPSAGSSGPLPGPNVTSGPNVGNGPRLPSSLGQETISIVPDELNNALIIRATGNQYREVLRLVEQMDVLAPQVLIEATIAEVTLTDDLRFGIRWFFNNGDVATTFSDNPGGGVGPVFPGFSTTYFDGVEAGVAIDALSSITDVSILSAPSIMVQNNQTANLQVGDEVPIVVQQAVSTTDQNAPIVSTVQLRETGVILEVKPRINSSDIVVLDVQQEVSEVASTTTSGIDSPTIQQRQFSSTVAVADGGTVALGGLIRESQTSNESGIPGLRRIPVAGRLFSSSEITNRRTELIIFLRPSIVRTPSDSEVVIQSLAQELRSLETAIRDAAER